VDSAVAKVAKEEREDITTVALVDTEAREVREDTTVLLASSKKMPDVKSFVTSMTYPMVSTRTLDKAIVMKGSFTKFVLKVRADSDMVARVAKEERVDTMADMVALADTEVTEVTVERVVKVEREEAVVSSLKNVLQSVHSHHHPVIHLQPALDTIAAHVMILLTAMDTTAALHTLHQYHLWYPNVIRLHTATDTIAALVIILLTAMETIAALHTTHRHHPFIMNIHHTPCMNHMITLNMTTPCILP